MPEVSPSFPASRAAATIVRVVVTRPLLVVVAGAPGVGKTALARMLGDALFLPVVHRDVVKEALARTRTAPLDREASEALGAEAFTVFDEIVRAHVEHGVGVVAEAAYQGSFLADTIADVAGRADVVVIECHAPDSVAVARYTERAQRGERHPSHTDPAVIAAMQADEWGFGRYGLPGLGCPHLAVDTTDGYEPAFANIVAFIESSYG